MARSESRAQRVQDRLKRGKLSRRTGLGAVDHQFVNQTIGISFAGPCDVRGRDLRTT
jgi:hypothetical protein